jgi:hypothetical protein
MCWRPWQSAALDTYDSGTVQIYSRQSNLFFEFSLLPRKHPEFSGRFGSSQFAGLNVSRIDWGKA